MQNIEKLIKKYKLTEEKNIDIGNKINAIMLFGKEPSKTPIAIFDIGPAGSGKTGLNGYALKQFKNNNLVIVNNDELRPFHPNSSEIARKYPQYYTKITNQESKLWTDRLIEKATNEKYNILYEGTGRKIEIYEKMISMMKEYKIIVRAMAVCDLNCLMSIFERYQCQIIKKGWGRMVSVDTFYKAYNNEMLNTIDTFERNGVVDIIEVYTRGDRPTNPIRIYRNSEQNGKNARNAIICGRNEDIETAKDYYNKVFKTNILQKRYSNEEIEILSKIDELYKIYSKERDKLEL